MVPLASTLVATALHAGAEQPAATITARVLKVTAARANHPTYEEAPVGKPLHVGDRVRTGLRARAEITLDDKSVIRVGQATDLTINPSREIDLPKGSLRFDFKNPARIRAGSTVADVRGSTGSCTVGEDGQVSFTMFSGAATLRTANVQQPAFNVTGGQAVNIPRGNAPPRIQQAPPRQFTDSQTGGLAPRDPLGNQSFRGGNVRQTVGGPVGNEIRQTAYRQIQDQTVGLRGPIGAMATQVAANRRVGRVFARFDAPDSPNNSRVLANAGLGTSAGGGTIPLPASKTAAQPGYFAPRGEGNLFLYEGQDGTGSAALRLRTYAAGGQGYWELAGQPNLRFHGSVFTFDLTDAFLIYKDSRLGDFTLGRQRFLKGPVQNTVFGTLLRQGGRDIQDAITFSPRWKNEAFQSDFAYIIDAFPGGTATAISGTQNAVLTRHSHQSAFGELGLNAYKGSFASGWGTSLDWSVPLVREEVDFYGEFGRDGFGDQLRTFGLYFPGLFERTKFDVFLEQSKLSDFGLPAETGSPRTLNGEWLLRVYRQLTKDLSALVTVDKRTGDGAKAGVGLVYRLRFN